MSSSQFTFPVMVLGHSSGRLETFLWLSPGAVLAGTAEEGERAPSDVCQAWPWTLCSHDVRSPPHQPPPTSRGYHHTHTHPFTDEGTEAPMAGTTCPRSQLEAAELGFHFQTPRLGPLVWSGSRSWKELGCGGHSLCPTHLPCKEGQPKRRGSLGTWGLAVRGLWPSHWEP